ncbi:hypothetical protein CsSME_00036144 [Camellia sinensis var. sinensis]
MLLHTCFHLSDPLLCDVCISDLSPSVFCEHRHVYLLIPSPAIVIAGFRLITVQLKGKNNLLHNGLRLRCKACSCYNFCFKLTKCKTNFCLFVFFLLFRTEKEKMNFMMPYS